MTTSSKQKYLDELTEFETANLFLTEKTDLINEEIYNNCIALGLTRELAQEISADDIIAFLLKVKTNRRTQLIKSRQKIDLTYYLWFDEMAGQLRFNFINSNHTKLPFNCDLNFADNEQQIIDSFIKSNYLNGIPFDELTDIEITNQQQIHSEQKKLFNLNVYKQAISSNSDV